MVAAKTLGRLQSLIWVLIYGGLLTLVAGLAVLRSDATTTGLVMVVVGGLLAVAGVVLIWVRSRLRTDS